MVLAFAESSHGKIKKAGLEAVHFAALTAAKMKTNCVALVFGEAADAASLGEYGATTVYQNVAPGLAHFDAQVYGAALADAAHQLGATLLVLSHSANGKALLGNVSYRLDAGSVSAVSDIPETENGFVVRKGVYSGKAIAEVAIDTPVKLLSVQGNAIPLQKIGNSAPVKSLELNVQASRITVLSADQQTGNAAPLPEAETVVSGGRGLKGPENWGILEDLANVLQATTACSRPVADADWRPHHEHVGQTGIAIRPNLYIAMGISGAIQHLAGVSQSKTIVVINNDPEAPFFKAANYGVVGDLFEVVPRLTEAIRNLKE